VWREGPAEATAGTRGGRCHDIARFAAGLFDRIAGGVPAEDARTATVTAFPRVDGELHAEGVALSALAERFGTPCYVYSRAALEDGFRAFNAAFDGVPHLVCHAVKANSNLAVLNILGASSGFDIVSGGELRG
jgi:hypothetical protein